MIKDKRIDEIQYEPDIFVYLKKGYRLGADFSQDGNKCQHSFGLCENEKEVREQMKDVVPCSCDYCKC